MKKVFKKKITIISYIVIVAFVLLITNITTAFFVTLFLMAIVFRYDSTIIGKAALLCLICIPVLLALKRDEMAEQVAVYAFFLLSMTVVLQIIELKRDRQRNPNEDDEEKDAVKKEPEHIQEQFPVIDVKDIILPQAVLQPIELMNMRTKLIEEPVISTPVIKVRKPRVVKKVLRQAQDIPSPVKESKPRGRPRKVVPATISRSDV